MNVAARLITIILRSLTVHGLTHTASRHLFAFLLGHVSDEQYVMSILQIL